jgi:acetyl esterase/lipase
MRQLRFCLLGLAACAALLAASGAGAATPAAPAPAQASAAEVVPIWPGAAPGTEDWSGPETDSPLKIPGLPTYHMISNVTTPTLTVIRPAADKANGVGVIVIPGGGFQNLAYTHEGEYVARWLAERGFTAFILKYRVRPSPGFKIPADIRRHPERFAEFETLLEPGRKLALVDGVQAMRFLRANASRFGIAQDRIGMIGFSAGAITTMGVAMSSDPADRPNFAAPIYGAMPKGAPPKDGPALFIAATQDDAAVPAGKSVEIYSAWSAANLPAELHIYQKGGHGFGMVKHNAAVDGWADAFEAWLKENRWLARPSKAR